MGSFFEFAKKMVSLRGKFFKGMDMENLENRITNLEQTNFWQSIAILVLSIVILVISIVK